MKKGLQYLQTSQLILSDYNVLHRALTSLVVMVVMNAMVPVKPHSSEILCNIN